MWRMLVSGEVRERIGELALPFNAYGIDPYGISRDHLALFYTLLGLMYRNYFKVETYGVQHVPERTRAMVVGNHSGSLPVDGGMVMASLFFDHNPPRHVHGMVEKFAQYWPFVSSWFNRIGQLPGLPEHAVRILNEDRILLVFPEGARGTGKLYKDRYKLVKFGSGFMRIALATRSPIVPFAFIGGEEALPAVYHAKLLAKIFGAPYWPVPPYLIPLPKPVNCELYYGPALQFDGDGTESDEVIFEYVEQVKDAINALIDHGREQRKKSPWERRAFHVPYQIPEEVT